MDIKDSDSKKIVALLESMAGTIDKLQRHVKPREADKARQARLMCKKLKKKENVLRNKTENKQA